MHNWAEELRLIDVLRKDSDFKLPAETSYLYDWNKAGIKSSLLNVYKDNKNILA